MTINLCQLSPITSSDTHSSKNEVVDLSGIYGHSIRPQLVHENHFTIPKGRSFFIKPCNDWDDLFGLYTKPVKADKSAQCAFFDKISQIVNQTLLPIDKKLVGICKEKQGDRFQCKVVPDKTSKKIYLSGENETIYLVTAKKQMIQTTIEDFAKEFFLSKRAHFSLSSEQTLQFNVDISQCDSLYDELIIVDESQHFSLINQFVIGQLRKKLPSIKMHFKNLSNSFNTHTSIIIHKQGDKYRPRQKVDCTITYKGEDFSFSIDPISLKEPVKIR